MFFCENKRLMWRVRSKRTQDLDDRFFGFGRAELDRGNCCWPDKKKLPKTGNVPPAMAAITRCAPSIRIATGKLFQFSAPLDAIELSREAALSSTSVRAPSRPVFPAA